MSAGSEKEEDARDSELDGAEAGSGGGRVRQLLMLGMSDDDEEFFGGFRLVKKLGQGGMGIVYEAEDCVHRRVALKRMLEPDLATASEERRFLFGAESQAALKHDHVVPVLHVDTHRGRPFFTMELLGGGHLGELLQLRRLAGCSAWGEHHAEYLDLMVKVADAVHFAHTHGLLHRDLKPANVLLDARHQPKLADFGLAKKLDVSVTQTEPGLLAGTIAYMAPEQARGSVLDRRADIYSLGAIFYELLTSAPPFHGTPLHERFARLTSDEPVPPPRELDPAVPKEVEDVCLKCLEKDREQRYSNALALRDDLQCLLEGRLTWIAPRTRLARGLHWLKRHPGPALRVARVVALGMLAGALFGYGWLASKQKERAALETNAFIANAQAGAALFQFREYADRLERAATDPELVRRAELDEMTGEAPAGLRELARGLDSAFVVSRTAQRKTLAPNALVVAQWPVPASDLRGRTYDFRDYFRGAAELARRGGRGVYLARAIRSERDHEIKFGISTPLYRDDVWVGVLVAIIAADSAFGRLRLKETDGGHLTSLIGPRDVDRGEALQPGEPKHFVFLIHDGLRRGEEVRVPETPALRAAHRELAAPGRQFTLPATAPRTESSYRDPVRGHQGEWYAAFAPVGATGYVLSVQSRKETSLSSLMAPESLRGAAPWLSLLVASAVGLGFARRRRRHSS